MEPELHGFVLALSSARPKKVGAKATFSPPAAVCSLTMKHVLRLPLRFTAVLTFVLAALTTLALTGPVTSFMGTFEGIDARLNWELSSETGVQRFELWRYSAADPTLQKIATVPPTGALRYSLLDQNLYKTNDATLGAFTYKLTCVTTSGDFNYGFTLSQTPSAVQRSWGSIKSMFR